MPDVAPDDRRVAVAATATVVPIRPDVVPTASERPRTPWLPPGRTLHLDGRGTTFIREIAGPPGAPTIMLLHGLGATADLNWSSSYGSLAARFHVVAIDHRGHGRGIRNAPFTLEDAADDAVAVLDVLGIRHAIAVGYSMGGPIAQLMWRRHPERIAGLVLCATSREFSGKLREQVMFATVPLLQRLVRATPGLVGWALDHVRPSDALERPLHQWGRQELALLSPAAVIEAAAALGRFSSQGWIGAVDVPTSVVVHLRDHVVPTRRQSLLAEAIAGATVHVVDGDHLAPVRDARRFVPALVRAIEDVAHQQQRPAVAPRERHLQLAQAGGAGR
ncbi:MAG: catD 6 [Acidimicrobiales bacterium]|nr:catD 6 [Acidimicrobiales bacterium]